MLTCAALTLEAMKEKKIKKKNIYIYIQRERERESQTQTHADGIGFVGRKISEKNKMEVNKKQKNNV